MSEQKQQPLTTKQIVVITGNPGSGKTETALNLALHAVRSGLDATVVDLDVVTPLYRSRDACRIVDEHGVEVIAPSDELRGSDLPLVPGQITSRISSGRFCVIDCGGGPTGALALGSIRRLLGDQYEVLAVVNPYRPFADMRTASASLQHLSSLGGFELASLVSNPHLGIHSTPDLILKGHDSVIALGKEMGVTVRFICCSEQHKHEVAKRVEVPVFEIKTHMISPWEESTRR